MPSLWLVAAAVGGNDTDAACSVRYEVRERCISKAMVVVTPTRRRTLQEDAIPIH